MMQLFRTIVCLPVLFSLCFHMDLGNSVAQDVNTVSLPKITPPTVKDGKQTISLPGTVDEIDVGGGGRYLALHFKSLRKIGIFDVNQLKIAGYVSANDDDTKFAAGATKLIVVSGDRGVVSRWDLSTLKRGLTQSIDIGGSAAHVLLGSASAGPAFVSGSSSPRGGYEGGASLLDLESLKAKPLLSNGNRRGFGPRANIRISANGNVLGFWATGISPSGLQTLVKTGDKWVGYYEHESVGYIVPSSDGRVVFTASGTFTNQVRRVGEFKPDTRYSIPAMHGPYYVSILPGDGRGKATEKAVLKMMGDNRPLATIPNLDPIFQDDDRFSRNSFTLDKRFFLIPDAQLVIQLSKAKDKLIAVKFDVEKAMKASDVDYLLVSSRPPIQVNADSSLQYQIKVASKNDDIKYSLDSGPAGMKLSSQGLLTWETSSKSPAKSNVIITVSDKSGQQAFHTFTLAVKGGDPNAKSVEAKDVASAAKGAPKSISTSPAKLNGKSQEIKLPGTVGDMIVGGNGRFLFFHLKNLKKIAVLDVSQAKIVHYLPAGDDNTKIVAGATRALIFSLTQGVVSRYRLDTFAKDLTVSIPFQGPIQYIGMGSGSEGPVLLRWSRGTGALDGCTFAFLDLNTLKPIEVKWPNGRQPHSSYRDYNSINVSTDGETFLVNGVGLLRINGDQIVLAGSAFGRSSNGGLPSADGKRIVWNGYVLNENLQVMGDKSVRMGMMIPSVTGNYFLSIIRKDELYSRRDTSARQSAKLYMFGDNRPLVTIPDLLEGNSNFNPTFGNKIGVDKKVFMIPDAKLIAVVSPTNDAVRLIRFDIDEALEASGIDYLIVDSQAPAIASLGKTYEYALSVKSKRGGVKYNIDSSPTGMKISTEGKITWAVPSKLEEASHKIIVSVSDASGQSTFHTFSIDVPEIKERLAEERRIREQEQILAAKKAQQQALKERERLLTEQRMALLKRQEEARKKDAENNPNFRAQMRIWTDRTGAFNVKAKFIELIDKSKVVLEFENGTKRAIDLIQLSNEDIYEAVKSDLLIKGVKLGER